MGTNIHSGGKLKNFDISTDLLAREKIGKIGKKCENSKKLEKTSKIVLF